jgi:guanine deaminase
MNQPEERGAWMAEAVRLSREGMRRNAGGPFGCVVVRDGRIIGSGYNEVVATNDPTAHAEILAIRRAGAELGTFRLDGCDIYASCEPCPMCLTAIYWARIRGIYYANTHEDAAAIGFDDARFYKELSQARDQRSIPMTRVADGEARKVFAEWRQKGDKILY